MFSYFFQTWDGVQSFLFHFNCLFLYHEYLQLHINGRLLKIFQQYFFRICAFWLFIAVTTLWIQSFITFLISEILIFFFFRLPLRSENLDWWRKLTSCQCCVTVKSLSLSSTAPTNFFNMPAPIWIRFCWSIPSTTNPTKAAPTQIL